mmetsp:Transcript_9714/g.11067  ORF Transcript_9714/g.11067 Transcript_9714/m.11067 type:complete len:338 (+) Transcript_9714:96-1109(+)
MDDEKVQKLQKVEGLQSEKTTNAEQRSSSETSSVSVQNALSTGKYQKPNMLSSIPSVAAQSYVPNPHSQLRRDAAAVYTQTQPLQSLPVEYVATTSLPGSSYQAVAQQQPRGVQQVADGIVHYSVAPIPATIQGYQTQTNSMGSSLDRFPLRAQTHIISNDPNLNYQPNISANTFYAPHAANWSQMQSHPYVYSVPTPPYRITIDQVPSNLLRTQNASTVSKMSVNREATVKRKVDDEATMPEQTTKRTRKNKNIKCTIPGCSKNSRGKSGRCVAHGGGRRCKVCFARAARPFSDYCCAHAERVCLLKGCKSITKGGNSLCEEHLQREKEGTKDSAD